MPKLTVNDIEVEVEPAPVCLLQLLIIKDAEPTVFMNHEIIAL